MRAGSSISSAEDEQVQENCFSCIQEYLKGLLSFIQATSDKLADLYLSQGFLDLLYRDNIKMYTAQLQDPARRAICQILKNDESKTVSMLQHIQQDLFNKRNTIPAHLLASNITQETQLVLEILKTQRLKGINNFYTSVLDYMWTILFQSLKEGRSSSAIAEQVSGSFIIYIKDLVTKAPPKNTTDSVNQQMIDILISLFEGVNLLESKPILKQAIHNFLNGENFLITALTLQSSQKVRN